ncbi:hypothetical protein Tco_1257228 [Tanacetum coccineum]
MVDHTVSPGFEQEVRLLKKAKAQVARCNERIHVKEEEIKRLGEEVESLKAVEIEVHGLCKERIHVTFEEFKKYKDDRVEKRCVEMDARLDVLSIDFDEEQTFSYVVSAGTAKGMSERLDYGVKQGEAKLDLAAIDAYDAKADDKYIVALHALKNLKYLLVNQLEKLKDAPLDLIMASLHLESDIGEDALQWIRDLLLSSSQLTIPVYPKVHNHEDPWAFKEEILLGDAIAANISHAKKKKKCGGLAILLADATTQTDISEYEASPKQLRSKSLPPFYNLD